MYKLLYTVSCQNPACSVTMDVYTYVGRPKKFCSNACRQYVYRLRVGQRYKTKPVENPTRYKTKPVTTFT